MKFEVTKIEKAVVTKPGANLNQEYAKLTLISPESGELRVVPVFDLEAKAYIELIGKEAEMPDNLKKGKWMYCFDEEFVFPGGKSMVRVDDTGKPQLNKFGQMYERNTVNVMIRCHRDDDYALLHPGAGPLRPDKGWDLQSRGTSVMNAFYVPLASVVAPGVDAAPGQAPAPAVSPV